MMTNTLKLAFLFISCVCRPDEAFSQGIKTDFVLVNTPHTFPGNASSCKRAEWRKKSFPSDTTIATYQNKICQIKKAVNGEYACKENHLLLNSAKYTDQGHYVFICNGENEFNLDVLYAIKVNMAEMDKITLKCFAANANDVTWLHNYDRVLHHKKDGSVNPGTGYEGRVSLEKNCFKTGDLSLTITEVRKTDDGLYRCFVDDETTKGYPHAHRLHVNEKPSSPGDQTDQANCNEAQTLKYKTLAIVFAIFSSILGLVIVMLLLYIYLYCRNSKPLKGQSTSAAATDLQKSEDGTNENSRMLLCNTSPNNESQLMDNPPVQESDTTGNKSSSTKPF